MQQMLKQVQKMQQDMEVAQRELANETVEASAGGGMVTVSVSGELELRSVKIAPEAVDPEDVDMLCDLVLGGHKRGVARGTGAGRQAHGRGHRRSRPGRARRARAARALVRERQREHTRAHEGSGGVRVYSNFEGLPMVTTYRSHHGKSSKKYVHACAPTPISDLI